MYASFFVCFLYRPVVYRVLYRARFVPHALRLYHARCAQRARSVYCRPVWYRAQSVCVVCAFSVRFPECVRYLAWYCWRVLRAGVCGTVFVYQRAGAEVRGGAGGRGTRGTPSDLRCVYIICAACFLQCRPLLHLTAAGRW
eukprot:2630985-Rhodomonas_salina.1